MIHNACNLVNCGVHFVKKISVSNKLVLPLMLFHNIRKQYTKDIKYKPAHINNNYYKGIKNNTFCYMTSITLLYVVKTDLQSLL